MCFAATHSFEIRNMALPSRVAKLMAIANQGGQTEEQMSIGLGYIAHLCTLLSRYLKTPLRHPIICRGSRSMIVDAFLEAESLFSTNIYLLSMILKVQCLCIFCELIFFLLYYLLIIVHHYEKERKIVDGILNILCIQKVLIEVVLNMELIFCARIFVNCVHNVKYLTTNLTCLFKTYELSCTQWLWLDFRLLNTNVLY